MDTQRVDPHHRPHPIDPSELHETQAAFARLLTRPADRLRTVSHECQTLVFDRPPRVSALGAEKLSVMQQLGFRRLALARSDALGMFGRFRCDFEIWLDPTTTIKAEVVHDVNYGPTEVDDIAAALSPDAGSVLFSTYFDDGTSLVMYPDNLVTDELAEPGRLTMSGTGDLQQDFGRFIEARRQLIEQRRRPLVCPDLVTYLMHDALHGRYLYRREVIEDVLRHHLLIHIALPLLVLFAVAVFAAFGWSSTLAWGAAAAMVAGGVRHMWKEYRARPRYPQPAIAVEAQ